MASINERINGLVYKLIEDNNFVPHKNQSGELLIHGPYRVLEKSGFNESTIVKSYNGDVLNSESIRYEMENTINIARQRRVARNKTAIFQFVIFSHDKYFDYKQVAESFMSVLIAEELPLSITVVDNDALSNEVPVIINANRKISKKINDIISKNYAANDDDINMLLMNIARDAQNLGPRKKVTATNVIIGINILFWALGIISEMRFGYDIFKVFGVQNYHLIVDFNQYWRFITPIFLHGGLLHMAGNSYFLYICGEPVERFIGSAKFVVLYLVTGVIGNLVSFVTISHDANSLGASGAVLGIGGVFVYLWMYKKSNFSRFYRGLTSMVIMIVINVFYGFFSPAGNIDNGAHVGGFLSGLMLAFIIDKTVGLRKRKKI